MRKAQVYVLENVPLPSGRIHMGHVAHYTMGRCPLRAIKDRDGPQCLAPRWAGTFPLDASGKRGDGDRVGHPKDWTYATLRHARQMKPLGLSDWNWSSELPTAIRIITGEPKRCFSISGRGAGLIGKNAIVNWDPIDMTVLATNRSKQGGAGVPARWLNGAN